MRFRALARCLALTASVLALLSAAPLREAPRAGGPVAAMMVGARPARSTRPVEAVATARVEKPRAARVQARTRPHAPRPVERTGRPLYVVHRALLR